MDQHTGCLNPSYATPLLNKLKLDMSSKNLNATMKSVELAYWDYLDNYHFKNRHSYPHLRMYDFLEKALVYHNCTEDTVRQTRQYCRLYDRYKKSIPTAGVILYFGNMFVIVKMKTARNWSMPKGKQDGHETLLQTAIREFSEETGIDLDECIDINTQSKLICKTLFYIVEADHKQPSFSGYNKNEISDVKWISFLKVLSSPQNFSRQTVAAAEYLKSIQI